MDKKGALAVLKEISIGIILQLISILALITIFVLLGLVFFAGEGPDKNNFDRLVGDIQELEEGQSKLVTLSIDGDYYITAWNYGDTMHPSSGCSRNKVDIYRPESACPGMCLCLCKREGKQCGSPVCVGDPDIGDFEKFETNGCEYPYLSTSEDQLYVKISRRDDVMHIEQFQIPTKPIRTRDPRDYDLTWKCFSGDTMITLFDGSEKRMDEIREGDRVLSYDESREVWIKSSVSEIFEHPPEEQEMYLINSRLRVTGEHRLLSDSGWVAVRDLDPGDSVFCPEGYLKIDSIERYNDNIPVYNFEVETGPESCCGYGRNYLADGFLAHNQK
jgi:hypothetical protein